MGNVHDDQLLDALGIFERDPPGDRRAPVVPDKKNLLAAIGIDEPDNIFGQLIYFVGGNTLRLIAQVITALVGSDNQVALFGKVIDLLAPGIPEFRKPMEEEDHRAVLRPCLHHMQLYSVGLNEAFA